MLPCHQCSKITSNPTELMTHLKAAHVIRNHWYTCSLCSSTFDQLYKFRQHTEKCFKKKALKESVQVRFLQKRNQDYQLYDELTKNAAFDLGCKLASNMSVPRNSVFNVIDDTQRFLNSVVEGFESLVLPWIKDENVNDFKNIISIMNDSLENVNSESKLNEYLLRKGMISTVRKVKVGDRIVDPLHDMTGHCNSDDGDNEYSKIETVSLMPIRFQIKSLFELPYVFKKCQSNAESIKTENVLDHFINGKLWKSKLQNFKKDDIVIPYHLYIDDTQMNNALGCHTTNGDQTCVYYSFPTLPNEFNSRQDNIFTAQVFESRLSRDFGNDACYDELIKELNTLADDGVVLNIDGKEQKVYFVLGLLLGDNKGLNDCLGYTTGFTANYCCRFCRMHRHQMQFSYVEDIECIRTIENYNQDLANGKLSETGMWENSVFNKVRYFHAIQTCADVMHDVNEGVLHYNLCEIILSFIKSGYFTLDMLNKAMKNLKYGEHESNNKSKSITLENLTAKKLRMTASEVHSFAHHLPFTLLNIIHEDACNELDSNETWRFLLTTLRFLDMAYLSSYDAETIFKFRNVIATMNEMYVRLFNQTLKAKHHFTTHYPSLIEKCGPLRYASSMRYEANHKFVKNYTKNTTSRRNIAYSLGLKLQYNFAYLLMKGNFCNDILEVSQPRLARVQDEDFYKHTVPSSDLESLAQRNMYISDRIKFNGLTLSSKSYLPFIDGNQLHLLQIIKLIMVSKDDPASIRIVFKKFLDVKYESSHACYSASNLLPQTHIITLSDVLKNKIFPVALHQVNGANVFRYKTF